MASSTATWSSPDPAIPSIGGRAGDDFAAWVEAAAVGRHPPDRRPDHRRRRRHRGAAAAAGVGVGRPRLHHRRDLRRAEPRREPDDRDHRAGRRRAAPRSLTVPAPFDYRQIVNRTVTGRPGSGQLLWPEQRPGETGPDDRRNDSRRGAGRRGSASRSATRRSGSRRRCDSGSSAAGIEVTGGAFDVDDAVPAPDRAAATAIFTHRSRPLAELAQPMLKDSINLYAEAVLRLNAAPGAFPTNDAALEGVTQAARGVGRRGPPSSSSSTARACRDATSITPEALLAVLRRMHDPAGTSPFMTGLPVAGVDGSLASRMRGTPRRRKRPRQDRDDVQHPIAGRLRDDRRRRAAGVRGDGEQLRRAGRAAVQAIDAIAALAASGARSAVRLRLTYAMSADVGFRPAPRGRSK